MTTMKPSEVLSVIDIYPDMSLQDYAKMKAEDNYHHKNATPADEGEKKVYFNKKLSLGFLGLTAGFFTSGIIQPYVSSDMVSGVGLASLSLGIASLIGAKVMASLDKTNMDQRMNILQNTLTEHNISPLKNIKSLDKYEKAFFNEILAIDTPTLKDMQSSKIKALRESSKNENQMKIAALRNL